MIKYYLLSIALISVELFAARLKDVAKIRGVRDNQLWGYGLVVGLAGTGDNRHETTERSLNLLLKGFGVDLKQKRVSSRNSAAVLVSTRLRPFMSGGGSMDVIVSSIGSATSLEGGTLVMTPLKGADGKTYAIAEGKVLTNLRTGKGTKFLRQSLVTGHVPNGATLEKEIDFDFSKRRRLRYALTSPDFTTASRVAYKINEELGARWARARDAGTVDVEFPEGFTGNPVELAARLEHIDVETDTRARVVINQRTGTIIMGEKVQIAPTSIAHNNIRIEIEPPKEEQQNEADVDPRRELSFAQFGRDEDSPKNQKSVINLKGGANVAEVASSLNALGAGPDDLILILQALKSAGALTAEVITR